MNVKAPKPPLLFGFRLTVYLPPQFLQINGRVYHPSLPLPVLAGLWLLPPRDFPQFTESHPMDHDSISSGHTLTLVRPGIAGPSMFAGA